MTTIFGKARDTFASLGWVNTCLYALSRALAAVSRGRFRLVRYYFTSQPVQAQDGAGQRHAGKFRFEWLAPTSPLFAQVERPAHVLAARFAQQARCLAAVVDGRELAGFLWFVVGPYAEDEVQARFVPMPLGKAAWDFDVLVQPRYRMGRLFGYLWGIAMAEMAEQGIAHTVSRISAFNAASIASHRRLGARIVGDATFVCVAGWQLMFASVPPRVHLSGPGARPPVLEIRG